MQAMWNLQKICNVYGKAFSMFTNNPNMDLFLRSKVKKTFYGMETYLLSCKEKVTGTAVTENDHTDSLQADKKTQKGATLRGAFYCQLISQN